MTLNIGFVLFPQFEELDFAGPFEVLGVAAELADNPWRLFTVAETRTVRGAIGAALQVDYFLEDAPQPDVFIIPGGAGARHGCDNPTLVEYVARTGRSAALVGSVCTGAFLAHRAGLLAGRRVTTHWEWRERLQALGGLTVTSDRWVQDGNVITAAGVSAGIDMALYLVGVLASPDLARRLRRALEYDPAPPYDKSRP